jgi:predicted phosphodiesterase
MALYGVLGDIHGNREALLAVLEALDRWNIDRLLCVGDVIGYNADPDECVALLRARDAVAICGNHDLIGTRRLGFDRCSNKAMHALKRTRLRLSSDTATYLCSLPDHYLLEQRSVLIHGGVRDVEQYMTTPAHALQNASHLRSDYPGRNVCFYGHTHTQRVFEVSGGEVRDLPVVAPVKLCDERLYFINPGSVDASRKRGRKHAQYAIFDSSAPSVEFFHASYNDALSEARAAAAGYRLSPWLDFMYTMRRRYSGRIRWT